MANDQEDPSVLGVSTQTRIIEEEGSRYVVVPVHISVGEIVERRFPLEVWTDGPLLPPEEPETMISFVGSLSRQVFKLGRSNARSMIRRRFAEIAVRVHERAEELGWYPEEEEEDVR